VADPDNDGIVNWLERAFGGNPDSNSLTSGDGSVLLPAVQKSGAAVDVQFPLDERNIDQHYTVQTSSDGAAWTNAATFVPLGGGNGFRRDPVAGAETSPGPAVATGSRFLITESLPAVTGQKGFVRLQVSGEP